MISTKHLTSDFLDNLENINSVLDLGCGMGKKSLRFAKKGKKVVGVDKNNIGIEQENFKFIQENIKNFEFKEKYDLIITSMILHFLNKTKSLEIIKKIQKNTSNKGYNFLICMSNEDDCFKKRINNFYPTLKELKDLYPKGDWKIVKFIQDFTDYEEHGNENSHRHNLIFLLARKI